MKFFLGLAGVCIFLGGCHIINQKMNLPDDNIGEQFIEKILEHETGIDIDLTPGD